MKTTRRIIAFLSLFLLAATAHAEDKAEIYRDWALRPSNSNSEWVLEQRVFLQGSGQTPLVHMAIQMLDEKRNDENKSRLWVMLRTPLGVHLQTGIQFQVDQSETYRVAFHHCRETGCIAFWPLASEIRKKLENGREARVTYQALSGESIGIPISLMGIKAGLGALDRKTAAAEKQKTN